MQIVFYCNLVILITVVLWSIIYLLITFLYLFLFICLFLFIMKSEPALGIGEWVVAQAPCIEGGLRAPHQCPALGENYYL